MEDDEDHDVQKNYLAACLVALRNAKNDTEKFAALLMVAKASKAQDCTVSDRRQILDAVGFPFFVRLLRTKEVPGGCPDIVFKSVAVSVLSAFMADPLLASDKQMSLVLPYLKEIFEMALNMRQAEDRETLQEMMRDTYGIVSKMACTPEGGRMLMDVGFQQALVRILDGKPDEEMFVMAQTVLVLLQCHFGAQVWTDGKSSFDQYLRILGRSIIECEDKSLFRLCDLTTHILNFMPQKSKDRTTAKSVKPLLEKLSSVITSKIGVSERQLGLALVNQLVVSVGLDCLLPPTFPDHRILLLVLRLTTIEVRLAVENATEQQVKKLTSNLCLHYNVLETMLNFLCENDESDALPLQADMFCQAHDALLAAANGVFYFLQQIDCGALTIPLLDPLTVASVRMIAAFTSQAFSEVRENVMDTLPFLLKLCQAEVGPVRSLTMAATAHTEREDTAILADSNSDARQNTEPSVDRLADTDVPSPVQDSHQPNTRISDTLATLHLESDGREHGESNLPSTDAKNVETDDLKDRGETRSTADTHDHSEAGAVTRETDGSSESTSVSEGNAEGVSKHTSRDLHGSQRGAGVPAMEEERQSEPAASGGVGGEETLPGSLEGLTQWIGRSADGSGVQVPCLEVMKFMVPVFQLVCEEAETRHGFVELNGHTVLVHFLLHRLPALGAVKDSWRVQDQVVDCQVLGVLMQLLAEGGDLHDSDAFTCLLDMALSTVPLLGQCL
ncbi:hypothetical protein ACOMHN_053021 [Nucella lapillus]